jgi:hypothetical protein
MSSSDSDYSTTPLFLAKNQPFAAGFDDGGGEPWLCKTTIRRIVLVQLFGNAA